MRPEAVAHLYPPGTRPDVFDDVTYAGLIPFTMRRTAVGAALGVPYTWARMRITRDDDRISYYSERRWPRRGLRSRLTVRVN